MTLEGHDPGAEETPAPPARTRWSEDTAEDDDALLPPYVPGARREPASPKAGAEPEPADPWAGEEVAQPEPEPASATVEPEPEPTAAPGAEEPPSDYPWEPEPETDDVPGGPELMDLEPYDDGYAPPAGSPEDDAALYGAYDLGGDTDGLTPAVEEEAEQVTPLPDLEGGFVETDAAALPPLKPAFGEAELHTASERLERLGEVLRREGRAGIERELASRDRLTALLAGVVAGYLAGLED